MHLEELIERFEKVLGDELAWRLDLEKGGWKFSVHCRDEGSQVFKVHVAHLTSANENSIHSYEKIFKMDFGGARIREREFRGVNG